MILNVWVVYAYPADFPEGYTARRWRVGRWQVRYSNGQLGPLDEMRERTDDTMVAVDLGSIRARLEQKGFRRHETQLVKDPAGMEEWW